MQRDSSISTTGLSLNHEWEHKPLANPHWRVKERLNDGLLRFHSRVQALPNWRRFGGGSRYFRGRAAIARIGQQASRPVALLDLIESGPKNPEGMIRLGLDSLGQQIHLNLLSSEIGNVLISGVRGAGKTSLMRTIGASVFLENRQSSIQFGVVDLNLGSRSRQREGESLQSLGQLAHSVFPVIRTVEGGKDVIDFLSDELEHRREKNIRNPILVVLIDGIGKLLSESNRILLKKLGHLLNHGAESGFRLFLSIEDPIAKEVRPLLKYDFDLRLLGRTKDADRAWAASGIARSGAELLKGAGEFLAVRGDICREFQVAYIAENDIKPSSTSSGSAGSKVLLAQPASPQYSKQDLGGPRRSPPEHKSKGTIGGSNGKIGSSLDQPASCGSDSWLTADWIDRFWMERE